MLSRRALVGRLAAGAAGAVVAGVASVGRVSAGLNRKDVDARTPSGADQGPRVSPGDRLGSAPSEGISGSTLASTSAPPSIAPTTPSGPPPWALLRPLTSGAEVAHGWHLTDLSGVVDGVSVLTLSNARGRAYRVHLCRNDGRPQGLVYTKHFDLVVMNGGAGELPTDEGLAQAVVKVARVLAANEGNRDEASRLAELMPHTERIRRFVGPVDRRLL